MGWVVARDINSMAALRPLVFPAVFLTLGTFFGPELHWSWAAQLGITLGVLLCSFLLQHRIGAHLLLLLGCFCLGSTRATFELAIASPPTEKCILEGDIEEVTTSALKVRVSAVDGRETRFRTTLYGGAQGAVFAGQRFRVQTTLRPLTTARNPGEVDRVWFQLRRGQPVSGSFRPHQLVLLSPPSDWQVGLAQLQQSLQHQVESLAPSLEAASFFLTLAAGQRSALGDELEDDFAKSGLAHVLSVSGLHVAVLALALFQLLRFLLTRKMWRFTRRFDARQWAAPFCVPPVWLYVVFTGSQTPAVRSAVMCSLMLLAHAFQRKSDVINALALALIGMCLVQPWTPFDLSSQLSFLSVSGLVFLSPHLRTLIPFTPTQSRWSRWAETVLQSLIASLCAMLFTLPLILSAFQRLSLAGFVSNVLALPLSGVITLFAAASAALHALWPALATPCIFAGTWASELFVRLAHFFASFSWSALTVSPLTAWGTAAWTGALWMLCFMTSKRKWMAFPLMALALLFSLFKVHPSEGLQVTFLSVGHGDAIVVSSHGKHALIDGGGVPDGADVGQKILLPYLRTRGITHLEFVALSHAHPDHALGLISALEQLETNQVLLPEDVGDGELVQELLEATPHAQIRFLEVGAPAFQFGEARVEILGPPKNRALFQGENDGSLVLKFTHGLNSFLFTGDIEGLGELALHTEPVTVLKAPHHGSDTSSSQRFVDQTHPQHVVYSVGKNNRYGFPKPEVVSRYGAAQSVGHRTDETGALTFHSDGKTVQVETFLKAGEFEPRRFQIERRE
jgi:competence protein ComEC